VVSATGVGLTIFMTMIAIPLDFLGINVYYPDWVRAADHEPLALERAPSPAPRTPLGLQIDPQNLRELLGRLTTDYDALPIWITENGISDDPPPRRFMSGSGTTPA
jgi:beta-glucosidase